MGLLTSDIARRILRLFSAQAFSQITTIALQLGLVPILLSRWGVERYGIWLVLSAVPTYLIFSDLGFTMVAKTRMMMDVNAGNRQAATRVFHSVFSLLNVVAPIVLCIIAIALFGFGLPRLEAGGPVSTEEARLALALLLVNVIAFQYFMLIGAGVRCENRAATELIFASCARLAEGAGVVIAAMASQNVVLAAAATLAARIVFLIAMYIWMRRSASWLALGYAHASWHEVRRLLKPASGFMVIPIAQALLLQGPIIVLGAVLGPVAVVTYSTSRTVTRVGTAMTNMFVGAVGAEYSGMFGRKDFAKLRRLFKLSLMLNLFLAAVYGISVYFTQDWLMLLFTHGKVSAIPLLFAILAVAVGAEMVTTAISGPLMMTNYHVEMAYWTVAISAVAVGLSYPAGLALGLEGVAGLVAVAQLLILGKAAQQSRHLLRL